MGSGYPSGICTDKHPAPAQNQHSRAGRSWVTAAAAAPQSFHNAHASQ